ncbi:hypothetical protein [Zavarzinella formosa]|uniref:hypothetical protein n=1 Tax=Zavarzinella formosa TaxID=360055 RepID=UPI0003019612|nr:hypothetical protein [Zavarzinella formosa]
MTQMTELAAGRLTPARAAEWVRVIELKCDWGALRVGSCYSVPHLRSLRRAFDAYNAALSTYTIDDRNEAMPDLSPNVPNRLRSWCRTVRAVLHRCDDGDCPARIIEKARKSADQIAITFRASAGKWVPAADRLAAIRQLDVVIAWCDERMTVSPIPAFEMGRQPAVRCGMSPVRTAAFHTYGQHFEGWVENPAG